ncbi:hypothetical protein J6590_001497 [Homalodisca vitripennis]|nr:hypothetical protein J6590_001497 [Homalodisca vitripennis]
MPGRKLTDTDSDTDLDSDAEDISKIVTKKSLEEAVALIYEKEEAGSKDKVFGGTKALRECRLASLKALNLCSAANVFTSGNVCISLHQQCDCERLLPPFLNQF